MKHILAGFTESSSGDFRWKCINKKGFCDTLKKNRLLAFYRIFFN